MSIVESPGSLPEQPAPVRRRSLRVVPSPEEVDLRPRSERWPVNGTRILDLAHFPLRHEALVRREACRRCRRQRKTDHRAATEN
jgi:hypothetical protein